jgi:release factor glutamine methyltransferase
MTARFMDLDLLVERDVLIPRAETELLGAAALDLLPEEPWVIDMCCGAGNLACAIASRRPLARVWASDLTDACVALARRNVAYTGVADRVSVVQGDLFSGLAGLEGSIDVIVCNPPYISQAKLAGERAALLDNEPREAFDGGPYGLSIHQRVVREALPFLKPAGSLLFEIGQGQERQVKMLFERTRAYEGLRTVANAAGEVRVVAARKINRRGN